MKPIISIITPAFNSERFIYNSVQSVLNQTLQDFELIIVDDCSKDETWNLLKDFANRDKRITIFKNEKNLGPAKTRNFGIKVAKGRYIAFLDSDDEWLPQKLATQIELMNKNDVSFSYSDFIINKNGKRFLKKVPLHLNYHDLLKQNRIGCLTAIYDTSKLGKLYMPEIGKNEDLGLWLQILKKTPKAYGIQEPLAIYNLGENTISSNKIKTAFYFWKILRKIEKINYPLSIYYFIHYAVRNISERLMRPFQAI